MIKISIKIKNLESIQWMLINSHGYGDSTASIFVWGTDSTIFSKVNPNEFTYAKIAFYSNAGFYCKMKKEVLRYIIRDFLFH